MLEYFRGFVENIFQQIVGISKGTKSVNLRDDIFLFSQVAKQSLYSTEK